MSALRDIETAAAAAGIELEVCDPDAHDSQKQSAEWYRPTQDAYTVAKLSNGSGARAWILATGEMWIESADGETRLRYTDELIDAGITTDDELAAAIRESGWRCEWNPWYEIVIQRADPPAPGFAPEHTVAEAIQVAVEELSA